jgi:hypothetical protein
VLLLPFGSLACRDLFSLQIDEKFRLPA